MDGGTPRRVRVSSGSHRLRIIGEAGGAWRLEGQAHVVDDGSTMTISSVRSGLTVVVPEGSDVIVGSASGRFEARGRLGHVAVSTKSGRVDIDHAASVDVRAASSRVDIGEVAGTCRVRTGSGRVTVGSCGDADVSTRSGRIGLARVSGKVEAHSVSGRITVTMERAGDVRAETVTGRIELSLPRGTKVDRTDATAGTTERQASDSTSDGASDDATGEAAGEAAGEGAGDTCTVVARSTTGKVVVAHR